MGRRRGRRLLPCWLFTSSLRLFACAYAVRNPSSLRLRQRQPDAEGGPAPYVAFQLHLAVVGANDALHDHQAEAGSLFLGGVKRLENPVDLFLRDAASSIRHAYPNAVACL